MKQLSILRDSLESILRYSLIQTLRITKTTMAQRVFLVLVMKLRTKPQDLSGEPLFPRQVDNRQPDRHSRKLPAT